MSSVKPDGIHPTAGKQVRPKRLPHVILWKKTPIKEEDMFHFVHIYCAVEALLCSCKVVGGTTPGKETQTFKCTEHEHCRNLRVNNTKQRHLRLLLFACALLVFIKVICTDLQ